MGLKTADPSRMPGNEGWPGNKWLGVYMKRPKLIYAIGLWMFFMSTLYVSDPIFMIGKAFEIQPEMLKDLKLTGKILAIVLIIGLVQLRPVSRIISIAILSLISVYILKIILGLHLLNKPTILQSYVVFSIFLIINILCVFYLSRKKFKETCNEYRKNIK